MSELSISLIVKIVKDNIELFHSFLQLEWESLYSKSLVVVNAMKASLQIWSQREDGERVRDSTVGVEGGALETSSGRLAPGPIPWGSSFFLLSGTKDGAVYFLPLWHYLILLTGFPCPSPVPNTEQTIGCLYPHGASTHLLLELLHLGTQDDKRRGKKTEVKAECGFLLLLPFACDALSLLCYCRCSELYALALCTRKMVGFVLELQPSCRELTGTFPPARNCKNGELTVSPLFQGLTPFENLPAFGYSLQCPQIICLVCYF